jgi:hypothetical protein
MGQWWCKEEQCSVRCCKKPPNWDLLRGAFTTQGKVENEKGRKPPEGKDALLSPY